MIFGSFFRVETWPRERGKFWYWPHRTEPKGLISFFFPDKTFGLQMCPRFLSRIFSLPHHSQGKISHNSFTAFSSSLPSACSALSLSEIIPFYPDEGGSIFLHNVCIYLPNYTMSRKAVYNFCIYIFFLLARKSPAQRFARSLASVPSYASCRGRIAADEGRWRNDRRGNIL